ncbi:type IV pilus biogenesis/stability protein PilW [Sulfuriferula nivalis]|uniref:Type IV pilus biogenesis/stability protein PilW n=1 Tax=Sulfuriferula nivalis TaxID=2675298 RepID=A0A809SET8_9PROT|nr:type IV pilus biogenesis/stability protein PilW [Sulfuriferula nivalis]BBP01707.1 type IV pilus biogenesis/stability protein PilW [Sulfuriferula nivalis]
MNKIFVLLILSSLMLFNSIAHADDDQLTKEQRRARIHTELGAAYFNRGQFAVALDELREALTSDNHYATTYSIMGLVYMELKEEKSAEDNFRRALDLAPNDSDIRNNYGWYLCTRKRYDESVVQFNTALGNPLYSTPERAMTNAGICSLQAGKTEQAEGYLEKSLKLQPNQAQALTKLSEIYFQQGRYFEAKTLIDRFITNNNPTAEVLWLGVRVARKQNNKDAEASFAQQLRGMFADAPETQLLLQGKFE